MDYAITVKDGELLPYDELQAGELAKIKDGTYIITIKKAQTRTLRTITQNAALHKYLELLAVKLNDGGFDIRKVLGAMKAGFSISCTKENLKEVVWRPMQEAMFNIESSKHLDTKQISQVYENVNIFTAERFSVTQEWPDNYSRSFEDYR